MCQSSVISQFLIARIDTFLGFPTARSVTHVIARSVISQLFAASVVTHLVASSVTSQLFTASVVTLLVARSVTARLFTARLWIRVSL